jgi:hypothetical protein
MRVLQTYRFAVGTKLPFDRLPGMIDDFLREQNLRHHSFHYFFKDFDQSRRCRDTLDGAKCATCGSDGTYCDTCRKKAEKTLRKGTACQRAARENPFLGAVQVEETKYNTLHLLHNFVAESNDAKEPVYGILPRLYRRYGFAESCLIYRDIDFFGRRLPTPAPRIDSADCVLDGSGIILRRSCDSRDSEIILCVQSDYPGEVPDASAYAAVLSAKLPGIKWEPFTQIVMDENEQADYEARNRQVIPFVKAAKAVFTAQMPEEKGNNEPESPVSVAAWLKKMAKRYGYTYSGYRNFIYFMEKKLPGGHCACLEFVSSPDDPAADPFVNLCGLGFRHEIWADGFAPQNPKEAEHYFTRLFDTLATAEKTVFPAILDCYPATPDWFVPSH